MKPGFVAADCSAGTNPGVLNAPATALHHARPEAYAIAEPHERGMRLLTLRAGHLDSGRTYAHRLAVPALAVAAVPRNIGDFDIVRLFSRNSSLHHRPVGAERKSDIGTGTAGSNRAQGQDGQGGSQRSADTGHQTLLVDFGTL